MRNCDDLFVTDIEKQKRREITELMAQWEAVKKADRIPVNVVHCSDGDANL